MLKPCPICKRDDIIHFENKIYETDSYMRHEAVHPLAPDCPLGRSGQLSFRMDFWNNRPIEDALQARIEELEGALIEIRETHDHYLEHDNLMIKKINGLLKGK